MAFIRKKRVGNQTYYQLVESYRPKGSKTPYQRVLRYLGKNATIEEALDDYQRKAYEERSLARDHWERYERSGAARSLRIAQNREKRATEWEEYARCLKEMVEARGLSQY